MTVDLTPEEMERVLLALKDVVRRRKEEGLPVDEDEHLIAGLEVVEREARGRPGVPREP